jgi:pimeloyl-ACP methyl ester carboxylesterase
VTIVLVHGAWGGSWAWKPVAQRLRRHGFEVYAPNLSGVGSRSHIPPDVVDLNTNIEDVASLLRFEELDKVLLVGHSYGGMVITGAADREIGRIAGMVYLDAFLPENGQSLWDVLGPEGAEKQSIASEQYDGGKSLPPDFLHPRTEVAHGVSRFTAHPLKTVTQPWISVRSQQTWPRRHYISCSRTQVPVFREIAQSVRIASNWSQEEFDAAHDVALTHADLVSETIATLAARWGIGDI